MDTPDTPTPDADVAARHAGTVSLNNLTSALCEAVGLDPAEVIGFQLTVRGGDLPQLQVFDLPPSDEAEATSWVTKLGEAMASTTSVVLPGGITGAAAMVQRPEPIIPLGATVGQEVSEMSAASVLLRMFADVMNGAGCDDETRSWLTESARELADRFTDRTFDAVAKGQAPRG